MMPAKIEKIIQSRILWVLSGLVPLVLFTAIMLLLFNQQQDRAVTHLINEAAGNAALVVERAIGGQFGLLQGLAASHALDQGDFTNFRTDTQRIWALHPEWRTVILTNEHEPLMNLRFPSGTPITPLRDSDSLKTVWETRTPFVGNLSNGFVAIRAPVLREGRMMYTLVAPTDPDFFRIQLQVSEKTGSWNFMVVGSDGIVISASSRAPATQGKPLDQSFLQKRKGILSLAGMLYSAPVAISSCGWRVVVFGSKKFVRLPGRGIFSASGCTHDPDIQFRLGRLAESGRPAQTDGRNAGGPAPAEGNDQGLKGRPLGLGPDHGSDPVFRGVEKSDRV